MEDDPFSRNIFRTVLEHFGYKVLEAADGFTGTAIVRGTHPDMVVLDLGLPGQDGWEVLRVLKRDARTRSLPVVIVTADLEEESRSRALEMGCCDFLTKPVQPLELFAVVQACLGDAPPDRRS